MLFRVQRARRATWAAALAAVVVLLPATSASAIGQRFGQVAPPYDASSGCSDCAAVQDQSLAPSYEEPFTGHWVITSWSFRAASTGPSTARLAIFRPTGTSNQWVLVAETPDHTSPANAVETIPARVPILGGDHLGIVTGADGTTEASTAADGDIAGEIFGPVPAVGATVTSSPVDDALVNVAATAEMDSDGDGYGDATQDACPADPATHGPCIADLQVFASVDRRTVDVGDMLTYRVEVSALGTAYGARGVIVSYVLPANVTFESATFRGGPCTAAGTCTIGGIGPNAAPYVQISGRAVSAGAATLTATVSATTVDPNPANNAASVTTRVRAPFTAVGLHGRTLRLDRRRTVRVPIVCPREAVTHCRGRVTLAAAHRTLASKAFTVGRGTHAVTIRLSKKAARRVRRGHPLRAVVTLVAHDARGGADRTTVVRAWLRR